MREGMVDKIRSVDGGWITIEQRDLGIRVGKVDLSKPPVAVGHTTETSHIDLDWGNGAAHFALGVHRNSKRPVLQQTVPLGWMATALANPAGGVETNRWARLQVECAWFSALEPYLPDKEHQILYASLMEFADTELGVPQLRPFPDVLDRPPMATTAYYRRRAGKWGSVGGWYNHAEVPENAHWDAGSLRYRVMLRMEPAPKMVDAVQLVATWREDSADPHRQREALSPHFRKLGELEAWMVKGDDAIRSKVMRHLRDGHHLHIARRQIDADAIAA